MVSGGVHLEGSMLPSSPGLSPCRQRVQQGNAGDDHTSTAAGAESVPVQITESPDAQLLFELGDCSAAIQENKKVHPYCLSH